MKVDFINLKKQYSIQKVEIDSAIQKILDSANFIMGNEVYGLEEDLERFTGSKNCITCGSGTDALLLSLLALGIGPGDEVITTPFTFIATAEVIALLGAKPVFVDIDLSTYNIDAKKITASITAKTKAIIPVSLFGQPADFEKISLIAKDKNISIIVDGAQSFGAKYKNISDSCIGDISITSFFPAKPLGCYGDGGAVFTSDDKLAKKIRQLRVHGQEERYSHRYIGIGGRLDTIQAAVLIVKLKSYAKDLELRNQVAINYTKKFIEAEGLIVTPKLEEDRTSAWAQYSIRVDDRDNFRSFLQDRGIATAVHYPRPLHLQKCFEYLNYKRGDFPIAEKVADQILSLPLHPFITSKEVDYIVDTSVQFYQR